MNKFEKSMVRVVRKRCGRRYARDVKYAIRQGYAPQMAFGTLIESAAGAKRVFTFCWEDGEVWEMPLRKRDRGLTPAHRQE